MPVITLARQIGSGGEELAALLGQRIGARILDRELLTQASARSGIPISYLASLDERGRSMLRRPLDLVRLVPLPPIDPDQPDVTGDRYPPTGPVQARGQGIVAPAYWAMEAYATLLARTMQAEAAAGEVIFVGRGGNEALRGQPGVLHVLVVASRGTRIERLITTQGLTGYQAFERVRDSDQDRRRYSRQVFGADWLDPQRYDLCINTDALPLEGAADVILWTAQRVERMATPPELTLTPGPLQSGGDGGPPALSGAAAGA